MSAYLFFVLVCCLLILFTYLGFMLYSIHIGLFILSFVILCFIKFPKSLIIKFSRHEKFLFIVIVIIAALILIRAGIIDKGIIAIQDYPIHYFTHYLMATKMIPQYNSVNGMYLNYQLGYSPLYDHPPGGPLLTTILWYLTLKQVPFWAIFRFVVAISFILPLFSVYYLSKTFGFHPFVSILSALLWLAWFHEYFVDGTFISYYSLSFGLFSIAFFVKYLDFREKRNLLASGLFLALSLLFQSMFYPFFVFSLFLLSVIRKRIKEFFYVFIISFLSGFVYFANFLSWDYSFQIFSKLPKFLPHLYDINRSFSLHFYLLSIFPILISLPLIVVKLPKKISWKINYLIVLAISLILISFFLNFLQNSINLTTINILASMFLIERVTFLDRAIFSILASISLYYILISKLQNNFLKIFVLSLLTTYVFTFVFYLFNAWHNSDSKVFEYIYGHKLKDWYSLEFSDGIFRNEPKKDVLELFSFLREKTTKEARIIIEDSRYGKLGGNIMALASYFTDKYYLGGFYHGILIEGDTWFVDGIIFGRNITDYTETELEKKFNDYNVKWIVLWSNSSKKFFSSSKNFKKLYETSGGLFQVYEYINTKPSYISLESGGADLKILNDNQMVINLVDVKKGENILIRFRHENYWHAFYNGMELKIEKCGILMCLRAPDSGSYSITLIYEEGNLLKIGKMISLSSIVFLFIFLLRK